MRKKCATGAGEGETVAFLKESDAKNFPSLPPELKWETKTKFPPKLWRERCEVLLPTFLKGKPTFCRGCGGEADNSISRHSYGESGVKFFCLLFSERSYLFVKRSEEAENPIFHHNPGESVAEFFCLLFSERKVGGIFSILS
ncbi:MAG: hypothetical protein ACI4QR_02020 [Eubacteriales bacterium]